MGICTFPIPKREIDLFSLPPLLSSPQIVLACVAFCLPSYLPLIHFLPSLPHSLFAVVVITFRGLKKVFVAGKEYALFRLPSLRGEGAGKSEKSGSE